MTTQPDFDKVGVDSALQALVLQRDSANNDNVRLRSELGVLRAKLEVAEHELKKLKENDNKLPESTTKRI